MPNILVDTLGEERFREMAQVANALPNRLYPFFDASLREHLKGTLLDPTAVGYDLKVPKKDNPMQKQSMAQ